MATGPAGRRRSRRGGGGRGRRGEDPFVLLQRLDPHLCPDLNFIFTLLKIHGIVFSRPYSRDNISRGEGQCFGSSSCVCESSGRPADRRRHLRGGGGGGARRTVDLEGRDQGSLTSFTHSCPQARWRTIELTVFGIKYIIIIIIIIKNRWTALKGGESFVELPRIRKP